MKLFKIITVLLLITSIFSACIIPTAAESTESEEIIVETAADEDVPQSKVDHSTEFALFRSSGTFGSVDLSANGKLWTLGHEYGADVGIIWNIYSEAEDRTDALSLLHVKVNAFYNIKSSDTHIKSEILKIHGNKYASSCLSRAVTNGQRQSRIEIYGSEEADVFENRYISYFYIINDADPSDCLRTRAGGGLFSE
ncbi:MAG: hypothetical protein J5816_00120 [Clostridia bacterium]|nr:hypothetical protein [Clostridia bacterium]